MSLSSGSDGPDVVPMPAAPPLECVKVSYILTADGWHTIIARSFSEPPRGLCRLCPADQCSVVGRLCQVDYSCLVSLESAPTFSLAGTRHREGRRAVGRLDAG